MIAFLLFLKQDERFLINVSGQYVCPRGISFLIMLKLFVGTFISD